MDGSRKTEAASPNCREAASEELFDAIKKLRSDGIQSPDLRLPEPLLKVLKLESDSPFARYHVSKALLSCAACLGEGTRSAFLFSAGFSKDITGSPGERVNHSATALNIGRRTLYRHIEKAAHEITHLATGREHAAMLPDAGTRFYTAKQVGDAAGVSNRRVMKTAREMGLVAPEGGSNEYGRWKMSKSAHSPHECAQWAFSEEGRRRVLEAIADAA